MSKTEGILLRGLPADLPAKPKVYANHNIAILKPNQFIVNKECYFEQYHFSVPTVTPPPLYIGKKQYSFKANRILAINPDQSILAKHEAPAKEYTALFINKRFLQEVAYTISGKTDVQFDQSNHIISKRLRDSFESFICESVSIDNGSSLMLDSISTQIAIQILREIQSNITNKMVEGECIDKPHAKKAIEFIEEYYNSDLSLHDLCNVTNLSPYHFIRVFKMETGKTPHEYLLDKRIQKALEMIQRNQYSLSEVAQTCGFVNQSHFCTTFKKRVGVNPSLYIKGL